MKSKKFPIIVIISLAVLMLLIYGVFNFYKARNAKLNPNTNMLGAAIETSVGVIRLVYMNGATMIDSELLRSTPCVDWDITVDKTATGATIKIKDINMAEVCVQMLATPEVLTERISGTTKGSVYSVFLENATIFEGALSPIQMPQAPTEGMAQ
ncbi:MAG: hypothetical protein MUD00_01805 [Candidatus Pacebacteria bacterium]|nr:hypothetical protein [Candidatus Paceibacterota bacterium]